MTEVYTLSSRHGAVRAIVVQMVARVRRDAPLRLVAFLALLTPLVCALGISFMVTPADIESGRVVISPPCAMRRLFGVECPTCGLTRAFAALAHGHVREALAFNHAALLAFAAAWVLLAYALVGAARALADSVRWRSA